jgi:hypothetical protein
MTLDDKFTDLLDAATADVPGPQLTAPLGAIRGRVRRRRRTVTIVAAMAVAALLVGGFSTAQWLVGLPAARVPTAPVVPAPPTEDGMVVLPWLSAMVARDDTTVTVYTGAERCKQLARPQATVTAQDGSRVSIEVTARIIDAFNCGASGNAVPLTVTLAAPLGERMLVDAVTAQPHPVYFERHLPDLDSGNRWSAVGGSWPSDHQGWVGSYGGPEGSSLAMFANPTTSVGQREVVDTVTLGPYQGTITRGGVWRVWWEVGEVTYSLWLAPREGVSFTLDQFKQEIGLLEWS